MLKRVRRAGHVRPLHSATHTAARHTTTTHPTRRHATTHN